VNYALFVIVGLVVLGFGFSFAYAHTTIQVDPYEIEVGWQDEPPVVGILNAITIDIREPAMLKVYLRVLLMDLKNWKRLLFQAEPPKY